MTNSSVQEPARRTPFRAFMTIWSGQAISLLGSQLVQFALIWYLTVETGSPIVLTTATLVGMIPMIVLGPLAGTLVDRWKRRWVMVGADAMIAAATVVLALLFASGSIQIWHIYVLLFIRSLGQAFHGPAMVASTSLMVPDEHLTRIQGLNQMLQNGMNIIAAPLGALLLGLMSMQGILLIDVMTAAFAITPLLFIDVPQPDVTPEAEGEKPNMLRDFTAGLNYLRGWPGMMMLLGMAMMINFLAVPAFTLLPLIVRDYYGGGPGQLAAGELAFGIGAVVGGVLLGAWGGFKKRIYTSLLGLLLLAGGMLGFGLIPSALFVMAIAALFVMGIGISMTNGPIMAITQASIAPEMQGRIFTLLGSMASVATLIALPIAGPLAEFTSPNTWFILAGVVTILTAVGGVSLRPVREIEQHGHVDQSEDEAPIIEGAVLAEPALQQK